MEAMNASLRNLEWVQKSSSQPPGLQSVSILTKTVDMFQVGIAQRIGGLTLGFFSAGGKLTDQPVGQEFS